MNTAKTVFISALLAVLALSAFLFFQGGEDTGGTREITLHCAAGLRKPVSKIIERYHEETGVAVRPQFAGSGELAAQLELAGGDLYLPADVSYIESTRQKGLVKEAIPVAHLTAGIAVAKGNPKGIRDLSDLKREDVRVSLANPSAAVGKFTKKVLESEGLWAAVEKNTNVFKFTVNAIAEDVSTGASDAAVVWDAVAGMFENVEFVRVPAFEQRRKTATVGVLASSESPTEALRFARFLSASNRGLEEFSRSGFEVVEGDTWVRTPEINLFAGSMLRPAIDDRVTAFEQREGVRILRQYEGCGILVSMMESGTNPDAYFSCDVKFLDMVQDRFGPGTLVAKNDIVLLVLKGNPKKIRLLEDLAGEGLKVGVAHPEKSALGKLTVDLLKEKGLHEELTQSGNVEILASKGDELVNQMQLGALDVAILYRSNANASAQILENCEMIEIGGNAQAAQPYAIHRNSEHRHLAQRLQDFLTNEQGKQQFLKFGFYWQLDADSN